LITALGQSDQVHILSWDYMHDLLKQLGIKNTTIIDREMGYQICKIANISTLVTGSFAKMGNMYVTDVKVIDPESKEIIVPVSTKGENLNSIPYHQIDELSRAILEGIDASDSSYMANKKPVKEITTSSLKAYRYFVRGKEEFNRFNLEESERFLKRAVELDSTFAAAHYNLSMTYYLKGQYSSAQNAIIKAMRHSNRASQLDLDIIKVYSAFLVENNLEKMAGFLDIALKKNPYNKELWMLYQSYYERKKQPYRRIKCIEEALSIDPEYIPALNIAGYAYAATGNSIKATQYTEKYLMASPGDANTMHTAGEVYYILGMLDESLEQFKELNLMYPDWNAHFPVIYIQILQQNYDSARQELDKYLQAVPETATWKAFVHFYQALFYYYLGEFSRAFIELESILTNTEVKQWMRENAHTLKGYLLLDQGNIPEAIRAYEKTKMPDEVNPYFDAFRAMVSLKKGQLDSARKFIRLARQNMDILPGRTDLQDVRLHCDMLQAEILLASDSIDLAIDYFQEIDIPTQYQDLQRYELALLNNVFYNIPLRKDIIPRALIKEGNIDEAIKAYEQLVEFHPQQKGRFFIHPLYHYHLAKLYQQNGQPRKAIKRFKQFIEIWINADEELPQVIDAKKQLVILTKQE